MHSIRASGHYGEPRCAPLLGKKYTAVSWLAFNDFAQPCTATRTLGDIGYVGHAGDFGTQNWLDGEKDDSWMHSPGLKKSGAVWQAQPSPVPSISAGDSSSSSNMGYQIDGVAIVTGAGKFIIIISRAVCIVKLNFDISIDQEVELARHARSHMPLKAREES